MKKQRTQLIILVVVLLLLIAGYFGVQKYNEVQANKEAEDNATYAIDLNSSDVTELTYTYEGVELAFVWEEDTWKYKDDKELAMVQSSINTMAGSVAKLAVETQIDNVTDMSMYGLDEPEMMITFVAAGVTYEIAVGDYNSISDVDYVNVNGSSIVYAVDTAFAEAFDYALADLVEEVEEETTEETIAEVAAEENAEEATEEAMAEESTEESAEEPVEASTEESSVE